MAKAVLILIHFVKKSVICYKSQSDLLTNSSEISNRVCSNDHDSKMCEFCETFYTLLYGVQIIYSFT